MARLSSEALFPSPITEGGTLPEEFLANYKAVAAASRAISPETPGFTFLNSSSFFVRAGD